MDINDIAEVGTCSVESFIGQSMDGREVQQNAVLLCFICVMHTEILQDSN